MDDPKGKELELDSPEEIWKAYSTLPRHLRARAKNPLGLPKKPKIARWDRFQRIELNPEELERLRQFLESRR